MVARLAREAGLDLGREADLTPAKQENPDGFWENVRFVSINDEILADAGGAWDSTYDINLSSVSERLRTRAELLARDFRHSGPWGWKDPRNSITLPFWRTVFPDLKILVCLRNPLEVALSLSRRNLFSYESSLKLWLDYNRRIMADTTPAERLVVHFDAFFERPEHELRRLMDFLDLHREKVQTVGVANSVKRELRHNRFTMENLVACDVRSDMLAVYLELCNEAGWIDTQTHAGTPDPEEIERSIAKFSAIYRRDLTSSGRVIDSAAFERDLYRSAIVRLEAEVKHLTAQRDWHAEDRDRLARLSEQHQAAADSQQKVIRDLHERLTNAESENDVHRSQIEALNDRVGNEPGTDTSGDTLEERDPDVRLG